jgi:hypothetical protein
MKDARGCKEVCSKALSYLRVRKSQTNSTLLLERHLPVIIPLSHGQLAMSSRCSGEYLSHK